MHTANTRVMDMHTANTRVTDMHTANTRVMDTSEDNNSAILPRCPIVANVMQLKNCVPSYVALNVCTAPHSVLRIRPG